MNRRPVKYKYFLWGIGIFLPARDAAALIPRVKTKKNKPLRKNV